MFDMFVANPLVFLLALLIGFATGWWVWADALSSEHEHDAESDIDTDAEAEAQTFAPPEEDGIAPEPADATPLAGAAVAGAAAASSKSGPAIAAAVGESDDLTRISGIGPKLNDLCQSLGVRRFDQIAAWSTEDVAEVDRCLTVKGRIQRDEWVPQAQLLAAGNDAEWERRYGADRPRIPAAKGPSEDLTLINGIGPKLAALCNDLGVKRFDQIAAWGEREIDEVDGYLGTFRGRITRDQWVEQAKLIAKGDMQGWKGRFGYSNK
ncbi:hypothetical protein [Aurantiacibacter sp. D1-12]|uniref:hypothetical protein n=1 Tax=Aurantiacibacter sp. D1-12 TaxID=2993658 RepID=UPI00237C5F0E|nr:hypothetical protein [Aurantiacibacter sp. D1-12]MDE1467031.1 hypothetical protein [Aurantiacibacter sp. D1-12]